MSLVRPGPSIIMSIPGVLLRNGWSDWNEDTIGITQSKQFWAEFLRDPEKQAKILADHSLRREMKQILDTERPYAPTVGLIEPKPEPIDEVHDARHFAYRFRGDTLSEVD